jgi:hypothetical protein
MLSADYADYTDFAFISESDPRPAGRATAVHSMIALRAE